MSTRHFTLTLAATVHLDEKVIDHARNLWETFSVRSDVDSLAEHIGLKLIQGARLSQLDGFADLPDGLATVDGPAVEFCIEDVDEESS